MVNDIKQIYHLSCPECGKTWWSRKAFPNKCPFCHANRRISLGENKSIKII